MTSDPLELLVDAAAAARITRWVVSDFGPPPWDQVRGRIRRALRRRGGDCDQQPVRELCAWCSWAEGTECGWCVGVYAAGAVIIARRVAPRVWPAVARWLACAEAAGLLLAEE